MVGFPIVVFEVACVALTFELVNKTLAALPGVMILIVLMVPRVFGLFFGFFDSTP